MSHQITPGPINDVHYAAIGQLVTSWSALEMLVNSAIWQIGEIPDDIGACLTSQLVSFESKIRTLGAVLHVRDGFHKEISALNRFKEEAQPLLEFRNRIVHDGWIGDITSGIPHRLALPTHKKNGPHSISHVPESTEKILQAVDKIDVLFDKFKEIMKEPISKYPPLPREQNSSSQ